MDTSTQSYANARKLVEEGFEEALDGLRAERRRRWVSVIVVALVWAACSVALVKFGSNDLVAVSEVGWIAVVGFAVFRLLTVASGRANLENLFDQYRSQLDVLEAHGVELPLVTSMEQLVVAIDSASPDGLPASDDGGEARGDR